MTHARRAVNAIAWNAAGTGARFAIQFTTGVLLARALGPGAFGVVAAAMVVIALGALVGEAGLGASLISAEAPSEDDRVAAQSLQLALASLLMLALLLAAGPIERAYGIAGLGRVLRVLSLQFPLQALGTIGNVTLKRRMDFRSIQVAQVASYTAGYAVVGMGGVAAGLGVWSLVAAQLTFVALNSALLLRRAGERVRLAPRWPRRELTAYGARVTGSNLGTWIATNIDVAVVGRLFGALVTGLYSRSAALIAAPLALLINLVQSVLFPAFAQARARGADLAPPYLAACALALLCGAPAAAFVATHAGEIVALLFGDAWRGAAPILAILGLTIVPQALTALSIALLWGVGRASSDLWGHGAAMGTFSVAFAAGVMTSPAAIAWVVVASGVLRAVVTFHAAARELRFSPARVLGPLLAGAALAGVAAAVPRLLHDAPAPTAGAMLARLVVDAAATVGVAMLALVVRPRLVLGADLAAVTGRVAATVASPGARQVLARLAAS